MQFPAPRSVSWNEQEQVLINRTLRHTFTGTADVVATSISSFIKQYRPDELMIGTPLFFQQGRRTTLIGIAERLMDYRSVKIS